MVKKFYYVNFYDGVYATFLLFCLIIFLRQNLIYFVRFCIASLVKKT